MIKYEVITSIDDTVFNKLFGHSIEAMDAGSYPWHLFPGVVTYEQKAAHIRAAFDKTLQDGVVFHVVQDGHVLMLNGGKLDGTRLKWFLGLIGPDINGSKAYLYAPEYQAARDQFWVDEGITHWDIETMGAGTPMYDHVKNAHTAGTVNAAYSDELEDRFVATFTEMKFEN